MVRRSLLIAVIAAAGVCVGPAGYAAELKVGYVDASKVLEEAPQAKAAREKLEKEFAPRNEELAAAKEKLKKMEERLSRDGAIMSESERRKLEREVLAQRREVRRTQEAFQEDLNIRRNEEFSKLQQQFRKAIQDLAKRRGYDLIVSNGVLFASERINITDEVLGVLTDRGGAGADQGQ